MKNKNSTHNTVEQLEKLDKQLIQLLSKRGKLLKQLQTKGYTPSELEKQLRQHWETTMLSVSIDKNATHSLFHTIQNIVFSTAEQKSKTGFSLNPSLAPVSYELQGNTSAMLSMLTVVYALVARQDCTIQRPLLSDSLQILCKMLNSVGAAIQWEHDAIILQKSTLNLNDVVLRCADSTQALYCGIALTSAFPASIKFVGGLQLNTLDLAPLKAFLQTLDIRVTSFGGVTGIPAKLESIASHPAAITCPPTLPTEYIMPLFAVLAALGKSCTFSFQNHPDKEYITATLSSFANILDLPVSYHDFTYTLHSIESPSQQILSPSITNDIFATTLQLLPPYFATGSATITGTLPDTPLVQELFALLDSLGFIIHRDENNLCVKITEKSPMFPQKLPSLPERYLPLLFPLLLAYIKNHPENLKQLSSSVNTLLELPFAESFINAIGLDTNNFSYNTPTHPWIAPSAEWAASYAYTAYVQKGLCLANPYILTSEFPAFWNFYNGLPKPVQHIPSLSKEETPPKRRILLKK